MKMWSRQTKNKITINNNLCFNINNKSYSNVLGINNLNKMLNYKK